MESATLHQVLPASGIGAQFTDFGSRFLGHEPTHSAGCYDNGYALRLDGMGSTAETRLLTQIAAAMPPRKSKPPVQSASGYGTAETTSAGYVPTVGRNRRPPNSTAVPLGAKPMPPGSRPSPRSIRNSRWRPRRNGVGTHFPTRRRIS